jgi:hypothetical protein
MLPVPTVLTVDTSSGAFKALLFVHILAAVAWIGGGIMITLMGERAKRARNEAEMIEVAQAAEFWALRLFIPGSLVLLAAGIGMVTVGHVGFKAFVVVGLVGWAVSFVTGAGYLGPQSGKLRTLVAADGSPTLAAVAQVNRIILVARIDLVILVAVIANMVIQPGGGI